MTPLEVYYLVLRSYRAIKKHDDQFDLFGLILGKLAADPTTFHDLPMLLTDATTINNNYKIKIDDAKGGDSTAVDDRDQYRDLTWLPMVDTFAKYVESEDIANGDKVIIEKSGFTPTKGEKVKSQVPVKMHIEAKSLNSGELFYSSDTKDVGQNLSYFLICGTRQITNIEQDADGKIVATLSGPGKVYIIPVRYKKGVIKGMTSEEKLSVYFIAANPAGISPLSAEAKVIIQ